MRFFGGGGGGMRISTTSILFLLILGVTQASQGAPSRNAPSAANPRNYSNPPHLSSAAALLLVPSTDAVTAALPPPKVATAPSSLISSQEDDQLETENFDEDDNTTLSDHTFQRLINLNHNKNDKTKSEKNSFLVQLSSYLLNKNAQQHHKSTDAQSSPTKAFTPQPLSFNTPNPPSTKSKPSDEHRVHPNEKHPPFEDYLGPIQFQSSLTQSLFHKEIPRAKSASTKKPSLYLQWDRESSEQEAEAEKVANVTTNSKPMWFLLALYGNETIAKLRRDDFIKYVRVNVATRLSMQYDEVNVIRMQLHPRILLNISIASSRRSPVMDLLAADTAPLLELSGEEYIIAPLEDHVTAEQQTGIIPMAPEGSHDDLEAAVCALAGGACALAAGAALLVMALFRRQRPRNDMVVTRPDTLRIPPAAVIYTGRLESEECKEARQVVKTHPMMNPRVQPDTLPLDARYVEELGLDNPNFLSP